MATSVERVFDLLAVGWQLAVLGQSTRPVRPPYELTSLENV